MMRDVFSVIAEDRRAAALLAIGSVADPATVTRISPVAGGASGASTLRVEVGAHAYLLRLDPDRRGFQNPARSYPCLRAAADAGIAPAVHHADEVAGIVMMDFVAERPATAFPGGQPAFVRSLGGLVAQLQATAPFPMVMEDFGALVEAMLNLVVDGGLFAPGVLDGHVAGLERIRAEYPPGVAAVSAHNDINPRNVLFDGERLWLVDWELSFGNDPFADLANIANNFSEVSDVDSLVLEGWLGGLPDDGTRLRLALMRDLHRLFYAGLMLSEFVGQREPEAELTAPTQDEFRAAIANGELRGTRELLFVLGKMHLVSFSAAGRS
jgi:aminoglycoside phosphotransferase (APT) family kinase protein